MSSAKLIYKHNFRVVPLDHKKACPLPDLRKYSRGDIIECDCGKRYVKRYAGLFKDVVRWERVYWWSVVSQWRIRRAHTS